MSWLYLKILVFCIWPLSMCTDHCFVSGRQLCYNCSVEVDMWKEEPFHGANPTDDIDCLSNNIATLNRMAKRPNGYVACQGDRNYCGAVFTEYKDAAYFRLTRGCLDLRKDAYYTSAWEYGLVEYQHADVRQRCSGHQHEFNNPSLSADAPEKIGKLIACTCADGDYCNHFTYDSMLFRYFHTSKDSLTHDTQVDFATWWAEEAGDLEPPIKDLDENTPVGYNGTTTPEFRWSKPTTGAVGMDVKSGKVSSASKTIDPINCFLVFLALLLRDSVFIFET